MTDEQAIGAVIDEMYAMISGPAGPRDWSRQANCFTPDARQIRTFIDADGRPGRTVMGLDDYARDTTPFFAANAFTRSRRRGTFWCSVILRTPGAPMKRAERSTMPRPSGAGSIRSNYSAIPTTAGASSR